METTSTTSTTPSSDSMDEINPLSLSMQIEAASTSSTPFCVWLTKPQQLTARCRQQGMETHHVGL
jgi:hypothetical protein